MQLRTVPSKRLAFLFASILILCLLNHCFNAASGEMTTADLPKDSIGDKWKFSVDYKPPFGMLGTMTWETTNDSYLLNQAGSNHECYETTITGSGTVYGENTSSARALSGTWTWTGKEYDVKSDLSWARVTTTINSSYIYGGNPHTYIYEEELTYSPPLEANKGFPLSAGKSWSAASTETTITVTTSDGQTSHDTNATTKSTSFLVVRTQMTTVSAGEFETFVVRRTYSDGTYSEFYYSPKTRSDVKGIAYDSTGNVTFSMELLEYSLVSERFPIVYLVAGTVVAAVAILGGLGYLLSRRRKKPELVPKPPT
jgi:hypothetical protein